MMKKTGTIKFGVYDFDTFQREEDNNLYIQLARFIDVIGYSSCYVTHLKSYLKANEYIKCKGDINGKEKKCYFVTLRGFYELVSVSRIDVAHDIRCEFFKLINF